MPQLQGQGLCWLQAQESTPLNSSNTPGTVPALVDMGRPDGQVKICLAELMASWQELLVVSSQGF